MARSLVSATPCARLNDWARGQWERADGATTPRCGLLTACALSVLRIGAWPRWRAPSPKVRGWSAGEPERHRSSCRRCQAAIAAAAHRLTWQLAPGQAGSAVPPRHGRECMNAATARQRTRGGTGEGEGLQLVSWWCPSSRKGPPLAQGCPSEPIVWHLAASAQRKGAGGLGPVQAAGRFGHSPLGGCPGWSRMEDGDRGPPSWRAPATPGVCAFSGTREGQHLSCPWEA